MKDKGILILTPFFSPNIGGVETHFDDLITSLDKQKYNTFIQTYSPITTPHTKWKSFEKRGNNIEITRYRWFGKELFHKVEKVPFFDFLYLTPYLFLRSFIWMIKNSKKIEVIHSQGINAALVGFFLKKIFNKKLITSTHAVYEFNKNSFTAKNTVWILNKSDKILCLSKASYKELLSFGIPREKLDLFKYWINIDRFKKLNKKELRKKLKIENKFSILFVGRMIEKKGIKILVKIAQKNSNINFIFIGVGPEEKYLEDISKKYQNIKFLGPIKNSKLHEYYNIADAFCIPSQYKEGFGIVIMEAVACGLPVIGSNIGGIPEAVDNSVSLLSKPDIKNLEKNILKLYKDKKLYKKLQSNCRKYAEEKFSEKNVNLITKYY